MTPLLALLLLLGSRPAPAEPFVVPAEVPWGCQAVNSSGPAVETTGSGWRFRFAAGSAADAGFAQLALPGDRLETCGVDAVELEYRLRGSAIDISLVSSGGTWRHGLMPSDDWTRVTVPFADLREPERPSVAPQREAWRFFRFQSPERGVETSTTLEVRSLEFPPDGSPALTAVPHRVPPPQPSSDVIRLDDDHPVAPRGFQVVDGRFWSDRRPFFPFGVYLMGGNRSLLGRLGEAGANTVVEYGPAAWPAPTVEDHLDAGYASGVNLIPALTRESHGAWQEADTRLALLHRHSALLAWYLMDEPDGAAARGAPSGFAAPGRLRDRREWLGDGPALVTCLTARGLLRYAESADLLSTDIYWPAYGPDRSAASIVSEAESVVEIAASTGALPVLTLQLDDPQWRDPERVLPAPALRATALGALAAGIRGMFFFQGVAALRAAETGPGPEELWPAFLELSGEMAAVGPLAARWDAVGGLEVQPALGEVRAQCVEEGGDRWIVVVNLGRDAVDVRLGGEALRDAAEIVDPHDGWRSEIRAGEWSGELAAFGGRIVRVVPSGRTAAGATTAHASRRPQAEILQVPNGSGGRRTLFSDRIVVGGTLYPAPQGSVTLELDGEDVTLASRIHRGPATVIRHLATGLASGPHTAILRWEHAGRTRQKRWTFQVKRLDFPFTDTFDRESLGDLWTVVGDVRWNQFDPEELPASGPVEIRDSALYIRSTGGSQGVVFRKFEAPEAFAMGFHVRLDRDGAILIRRNELFRRVELKAGSHLVVWRETPDAQRVFVDDRPAGEWKPSLDHRGGGVALGVPPGGEAWFEDFRVEMP
jgi:hypothetical protein